MEIRELSSIFQCSLSDLGEAKLEGRFKATTGASYLLLHRIIHANLNYLFLELITLTKNITVGGQMFLWLRILAALEKESRFHSQYPQSSL